MEKLMAEVWQEVLGMNGFGVNDNFFDICGHSLLSVKVIYEVERKLDIRINPKEMIFKNLGQLAAFCEELRGTQESRVKDRFLNRIKEAIWM